MPEYSHRLWNDLIIHRYETEAQLPASLTKRQTLALRSARTKLETRILNYIVEDYVDFLGQYLGLGHLEFDSLQGLLKAESKKKYDLILRQKGTADNLRTEISEIDAATRKKLENILDPEQRRAYVALDEVLELVG